jgi:C_GCAxxG_C_C family probable redox protein
MAEVPQRIVPDEELEESLLWIEEMARGYQAQYGGCAQCVLLPIQKKFGLPGGTDVIKAAGYFGLGVARLGDTCGALSGALMALGLASGRASLKDPAYPEPNVLDEKTGLPKSLVIIREFYTDWVKTFGGHRCSEVQKKLVGRSYDLGDNKEFKMFKEATNEVCPETVAKTARMAAETILKLPRR